MAEQAAAGRDFWRTSGYRLLDRNADGYLAVTDDFIRAYLMRPELEPCDESCGAELALHRALMADPFLAVDSERLGQLADADVRENYALVLGFRDRLMAAGTVEGAYLAEFRADAVTLPAIFIHQMTHVVLRNILDDKDYPFCVRAAEAFFRQQSVTIKDGAALLADSQTVEMFATTGGLGDIGRLIAQGGATLRQVDMDVLRPETAATYWDRNEAYDLVLDISFGRPGLDGLARVLEWWVHHFLKVGVRIEPVHAIDDDHWSWHIGLDAEATRLLNALYNGDALDDDEAKRLLALFRLTFLDETAMRADLAGKPVYLAIAMDEDRKLRLKPQNLLVNLPLRGDGA